MGNKAVFFDRDGIVNLKLENDYVKNIDEFIFNEDFFETFIIVKSMGFLAFLITNQQGIGKGLYTETDLQEIHTFMQNKLAERTNFTFDEISFAPNLAKENNYRRKPNPGMITEILQKYSISSGNAIMIGDSYSDILAAKNAEIRSIQISKYIYEISPNFHFQSLGELNLSLQNILMEC
jgi:D,D-heptose 1,7-bisphosphate phosphatase